MHNETLLTHDEKLLHIIIHIYHNFLKHTPKQIMFSQATTLVLVIACTSNKVHLMLRELSQKLDIPMTKSLHKLYNLQMSF